MIVICEKCGRKYKIDEAKIKGDRIRIKCRPCGNIMEAIKPKASPDKTSDAIKTPPPEPEQEIKEAVKKPGPLVPEEESESPSPKKRVPIRPGFGGMSISMRLLLMFLASVVVLGGALVFVYLRYVPRMMEDQIELRAHTIAHIAGTGLVAPMLERNYLQINKRAVFISKLHGVGYFFVLNRKGVVVAGSFGDLSCFTPSFAAKVKKRGFPVELARQNRIPRGKKVSHKALLVGGKEIHEHAVLMGKTGAEVHVGMLAEEARKLTRGSLIPLIIIMVVMAIIGGLSFIMIARSISVPIRSLTDAAQRISLGELDLPITVKGSGEIAELSKALERMRFSVQSAIERLRRR